MAARALYVPWYQNASRSATWSVTAGTADPQLVADYLGNGNPALGCRILSTQGAVRAAHASAVSVAVIGLIHHSLDEGLAVRVEGSDDPAFGSTDFSEAITIGSRRIDGYRDDWLDIETALGMTVPSNLYHRVVVDADTNSVNLAFGEIVLSTSRNTMPWLLYQGAGLDEVVTTNELPTYTGTLLRHPKAFPRVLYQGTQLLKSPTEYNAAIDLFRGLSGRARPLMLVPVPTEDLCHFGILSLNRTPRSPIGPALHALTFGFEELSRGLTWNGGA